jgi:hypothetical protein
MSLPTDEINYVTNQRIANFEEVYVEGVPVSGPKVRYLKYEFELEASYTVGFHTSSSGTFREYTGQIKSQSNDHWLLKIDDKTFKRIWKGGILYVKKSA